ncbi:hypothetical protein NDU88_006177 [Pleurodeles waltl]|uniref:Uncharacterized protein n=1 Tax=Pleurodeles waltl TaxID=8319 RepID=A0AAV7TCQ1_PLEWA|nr:hypothetical protein NDU88_006177 [Pleurodeles waltl]
MFTGILVARTTYAPLSQSASNDYVKSRVLRRAWIHLPLRCEEFDVLLYGRKTVQVGLFLIYIGALLSRYLLEMTSLNTLYI